jgi:hypothetical protein
MVRIVRLSLEDGVSLPHDVLEVEWPKVELRRQRQKGGNAAPEAATPKRPRGRPRKNSPGTPWRLIENAVLPSPMEENPGVGRVADCSELRCE